MTRTAEFGGQPLVFTYNCHASYYKYKVEEVCDKLILCYHLKVKLFTIYMFACSYHDFDYSILDLCYNDTKYLFACLHGECCMTILMLTPKSISQ